LPLFPDNPAESVHDSSRNHSQSLVVTNISSIGYGYRLTTLST